MNNNRRKILFFNQHFAYISKDLMDLLTKEKKITDINEYIKKKAKKQFKIDVKSIEDIDELVEKIRSSYYDSPSDWVREKIREDLKLESYKYSLDDLLCLSELNTEKDIEEAINNGYSRVYLTADKFKERFPLLDINKVFFNNIPYVSQVLYYDKDKHAIVDIPIGFLNGDKDNYAILTPPGYEKSADESILERIDYINQLFNKKEYEYYAYVNFPLYINELIGLIIRDIEDVNEIKKLKEVQKQEYK